MIKAQGGIFGSVAGSAPLVSALASVSDHGAKRLATQ
jgi:hypothetical protein